MESSQKCRHLQIAAVWYHGNKQQSVWPAQQALVFGALALEMSRVLNITEIHKQLKQETLKV